jgi:hypothetical protein
MPEEAHKLDREEALLWLDLAERGVQCQSFLVEDEKGAELLYRLLLTNNSA